MDLQDVPVTLVIKAPNQRMEDLTVDCMLGWTIRKLKQHLERVYPSQPKETEQRLIYSGKLLQDHLTLKEILHQYDMEDVSNTHTVHLVCSSSKATSSSCSASQKAKEEALSKSSSTHTTSSPLSPSESSHRLTNVDALSTPSGQIQADGLRFRGHAPNVPPSPQSHPWGQIPYPPAATTHPYSQEQYTWMMQQQQLYSQYMMQYMQYYQGMYSSAGQPFVGGVMPPSPFGMPPTTVAPPIPQPQQQQQLQQRGNQQQAPQPPAGAGDNAQRQNMRMNAQGGMEEDDDDEGDPRDWLHHTYFLMRLLTFLGILFFYSSFSRFLMVFVGSFAIYFFQKLRKYMQRAQREREQQREQAQQEQAQQQQQNGGQPNPQAHQQLAGEAANEPVNGNGVEAGEENAATVEQSATEGETTAPVQDNGSRVARLFVFVSRTIQLFFTSLVPAPAELLEAN